MLKGFHGLSKQDVARALHLPDSVVQQWMDGDNIPTESQIHSLISLYGTLMVEPIVEFYEVSPYRKGTSRWHLVSSESERGKLYRKIQGEIGLYVFYDSAGHIIYLGKSEVDLLFEMRQRLHAVGNKGFYAPLKREPPVFAEMTKFVSVYKVLDPHAIHNIEVLLLRGMANDAANKNKGKFRKSLSARHVKE